MQSVDFNKLGRHLSLIYMYVLYTCYTYILTCSCLYFLFLRSILGKIAYVIIN